MTVAAGLVLRASDQAPSSPQPPSVFGAAATAVLVDVVVRDAEGKVVTDLENKDFAVFEDGARQTIASFEPPLRGRTDVPINQRDEPTRRETTAARVAPSPTGTPRLVALVFEQLEAEARAAAHKTARAYLHEQRPGDDFVGVFVIDRALQTLLPYSRDAGAIERAVRTAVMRPGCPQQVVGDVPGAADGGEGCREDLPNRLLAGATMAGLRALVEPLQLVPGRKSVLLFSEGFSLEVTSDVMERFNALVGLANRSGVSFYTVDAAGLRAQNPSAAIRKRMRTYSAEDQSSLTRDSVSPDEMMSGQPYVALERLGRETGGAFLDNTNELERAGHRMSEDFGSHYLLGYAPTNASLDGAFRRIKVDVARPGVTVQARAGYLAVPVRRMLAPHDVAPLLALESGTLPHDFRLDAEVTPRPDSLRIVGRVAHRALKYEEADATRCRARLTMLARVVDKDGRTLWMNSDAFDLSSPSAQCEAAKRLTSEFVREVTLSPKASRIDIIAFDAVADRASVRQFDLAGTQPR